MLRPAVLRAARVALGDDFYAASIRDARVACLRPGVSAKTARAAAAALEAEASPSETPLPVAVREIFSKGLMRRLPVRGRRRARDRARRRRVRFRERPEHVVPALVRALGEDTHLATVASAARRPAERFERFERVSKKSSSQKDDDDREVTPRRRWRRRRAPRVRAAGRSRPCGDDKHSSRGHSTQVEQQDFSRESGAAAALASVLPHVDRATLLRFLFPAFPAPPGPLLRILLAPAPSLTLCVAAAELVAAAAARLSPDDAFARALPRLKPLFAVACRVSDDEEEDAAALTLAFALYPALGDRVGFRALRDAVPDAPLLETRFATRFDGWTAEQHYERSRNLTRRRGTDASREARFLPWRRVPKPFRDSAPHSWLPAPDARELETAALLSRGWVRYWTTIATTRRTPSRTTTTSRVGVAPGDAVLVGARTRPGHSPRTPVVPKRTRSRSLGTQRAASPRSCPRQTSAGWRRAAPALFLNRPWSRCGRRAGREASSATGATGTTIDDAPAPAFATHDAHGGRVTCVTFKRVSWRRRRVGGVRGRRGRGARLARGHGRVALARARASASRWRPERVLRGAAFRGSARRLRVWGLGTQSARHRAPEADRRRSNGPRARRGRGRGR